MVHVRHLGHEGHAQVESLHPAVGAVSKEAQSSERWPADVRLAILGMGGCGEVKARSRRGQGDARSEKSDSSANARWLGKGQGGKALRPERTLRLGVNIVEAMPWENEHLEGQYI